jgi:methylmalonyl-CoA mutase N-terminal domain/subunit
MQMTRQHKKVTGASERRQDISRPIFNESGIEIKKTYTAEDLEASGGVEMVGLPGEYPFTRGIHKEMYRKRPWTMRQYTGFGNPEDTNERFKFLIENGQTGLNVAFDLPSQIGIDSDDDLAIGEIGRVGMAVDSLRDFEVAFDGIDLEKITVSLTVNGSAAIMIAMYLAMAEKRGYDISKLRGTAQNDILKEFIGRGTWIFPVEPSIKLVADTIEYCANHAPKYSGADPAQEMAYGFVIAKAYTDLVLERGLDVDEFASRLSFNFNIYGNIFEQVAKFRAGRGLWAKIIKEEYGATNPRSMVLRMIAGGGGSGLTKEQPEVNIVRGAYYALISALSGAQTMALCCYDEAYTIPSESAQTLSLRTMQVLIEEMGLCDTVDPLAGSYYIETLTNQMRDRMVEVMKEVDEQGGIVKMVAEGTIQSKVSAQAYELLQDIESGEFPKVGINCYQVDEDEPEVEYHPYAEDDARLQIERLGQLRDERDSAAVESSLEKLVDDARAGVNVMPAIMVAVKAYATVGEMTDALVSVYGRYNEPVRF